MRALVLVSLLGAVFAWSFAQDEAGSAASGSAADPTAESVARLTVVPNGEQSFDLLTGETTLSDGGTILDTQTGLRLEASFIRYLEGAYIDAEEARAETAGGTLGAPTLEIDVPGLVATAPDGVRFERPGLAVTASRAELRFGPELARFDLPVGERPELAAQALLLDLSTGDALLIGPYHFQDGPFALRDDRETAVLQLRPVVTEDGTFTYRAANEVDDDLWESMESIR